MAWKGLGVSHRHRPVARPASLFLDSGRGWSPREAWHCSEHGQGWSGADSSHARGHLGGRKQLKGVPTYRREDSMMTVFRGKAGVHFWEASVGFCGGSHSFFKTLGGGVGMGRLIEPQKCPLHAWLSFWGCPHRLGNSLRGWEGSTLCPRGSQSLFCPLPEPRSYVESVVRTAVAGPRAQDPEPKSFSAPAAQAYGHETPLRNGTLGGSFVSPSPLSTSSPILSADR